MKSSIRNYWRSLLSQRTAWLRVVLIGLLVLVLPLTSAEGANWTTASVSLSNPQPSATGVTYDMLASGITLSAIQCIKIVFATTATGSTEPTGMVTTSAALDSGTTLIPTPGSFSRGGSDPAGTVTFTGSGQTPSGSSGKHLIINTMTNSSVADTSFFMQVSTFNNTDCVSSPVDNVTVAFINTAGSSLSLSVSPTLSFSVAAVASGQTCNGATATQTSTSTTIPFGAVTTATNSVVCQDLAVTTNAITGYTVYIRYTAKPTSGSNTIADAPGSNASPSPFPAAGTEAYGYTTEATALQNSPANRFTGGNWAAATTTNAEVAYSNVAASHTTRVGHQAGVSGTTQPGTYTTTIIYTCTPIY
ncbi:MAG: hypothetical protein ACHQUB_01815 [Candidatus Saccharimonadia bacterium]